MRICIVGGGKVGFYLARTLIEHGHTPVVIEEKRAECTKLANSLDLTIVHGDGTQLTVLRSAELEKCGALVAVSGADEDNLIACQLAKKVFNIPRTVARVNNPRNTEVLRMLGVDIAVSATDNLARLIEREVETDAIRQVVSVHGGSASITEVTLPADFYFNGKTLSELTIPQDCIVIIIERKGEMIIPRGNTQLLSGDVVMLLAKETAFHQLTKSWKLDKK